MFDEMTRSLTKCQQIFLGRNVYCSDLTLGPEGLYHTLGCPHPQVPQSGPAGAAHASAQLHARTAEAAEPAPPLVAGKPQAAAAGAGGCQQQAEEPTKLPAAPVTAAALAVPTAAADSGSPHAPQEPAVPMTRSGSRDVGSAGQECGGSTGDAVLAASWQSGVIQIWHTRQAAAYAVPGALAACLAGSRCLLRSPNRECAQVCAAQSLVSPSKTQPSGGMSPVLLMLMPLLPAEMLEIQAMTKPHYCIAWSIPLCLVRRLYMPA